MLDTVFLCLATAVFGAALAYILVCERLASRRSK